jgi:hypothetical protein
VGGLEPDLGVLGVADLHDPTRCVDHGVRLGAPGDEPSFDVARAVVRVGQQDVSLHRVTGDDLQHLWHLGDHEDPGAEATEVADCTDASRTLTKGLVEELAELGVLDDLVAGAHGAEILASVATDGHDLDRVGDPEQVGVLALRAVDDLGAIHVGGDLVGLLVHDVVDLGRSHHGDLVHDPVVAGDPEGLTSRESPSGRLHSLDRGAHTVALPGAQVAFGGRLHSVDPFARLGYLSSTGEV